MLAKRIIPSLLVRGRQLVKGQKFQSWRSVGIAEQAARIYARRGVDELLILDIGATPEGRGPDFAMVERMTDQNYCPVSVGGGVRDVEDVRELLRVGADKVVIGTRAMESPELIKRCADKFGRQAICVAIDVGENGFVWRHCGTECGGNTQNVAGVRIDPVGWAQYCERLGAGEIILTSITRDGMMQGYDLEMIRAVSDAVDIPVIASGGCGTYEHMVDAIQAGADAVAAGAMFLFTEQTPKGAAEYLNDRGVTCRL